MKRIKDYEPQDYAEVAATALTNSYVTAAILSVSTIIL